MATVTIVDEDRIWFKATQGLHRVTEIDRETGLCASAILLRWHMDGGSGEQLMRNLADVRSIVEPAAAHRADRGKPAQADCP